LISQISGRVRSVVALLALENNETAVVTLSGDALRQLAELPEGPHVKVTGTINDSMGVHRLAIHADAITAT